MTIIAKIYERISKVFDTLKVSQNIDQVYALYTVKTIIDYIQGRLVKVVPLNIVYTPKRGDMVIGQIVEIGMSSWFVDIGCQSDGVIPLRDGSNEYIRKG